MAMPLLLKLLTATTLVVPMFCVTSLFPSRSINVFGRQMSAWEWWSSGAGLVTIVIGGLVAAAALLMLKRSRHGRPMYIAGWVAISASVPLVAYLTGGRPSGEIASLISNLVLTVSISIYLYKSRAVREYFATELSPRIE